MNSLSSINTSYYSELLEGFALKSLTPIKGISSTADETVFAGVGGELQNLSQEVDLSDYYNQVKLVDILSKTGQNVVEAAQVLDNTMVIAMQNGYSVQDICNIKLAEMAYKANAYMFNAVSEISTFALEV